VISVNSSGRRAGDLANETPHDGRDDCNENNAMAKKNQSKRSASKHAGPAHSKPKASGATRGGSESRRRKTEIAKPSAARPKKSAKSDDRTAAMGRKRERLSALQREMLVRIGKSGPKGFFVGGKDQATTRSLLRRGLIRETKAATKAAQPGFALTERGVEAVSAQAPKPKAPPKPAGRAPAKKVSGKIPPKAAAPRKMNGGARPGPGFAGPAVREPVREYIPAVDDVVMFRRSGPFNGRLARVKRVYMSKQMACVCRIINEHDCAVDTVEFEKLLKSDEPFEDCSCDDCPEEDDLE
jgi:hypothetical protein